MKSLEQSREGACRRRLHFGQTHAEELSGAAADSPQSICGASPEASPASPVHRVLLDDEIGYGELLLRSPTHDGGIRIGDPAAAADVAAVRAAPGNGLLDGSSRTTAARELQQANVSLMAVFTSNRPTLQQLCSPPVLVPEAAGTLCSPPAAAVAALPPPPRKRSIETAGGRAPERVCKAPFRAARALMGLAPTSTADLQNVRTWLTLLETH